MRTVALIWLVAHALAPDDAIPAAPWDGASWRAISDEAAKVTLEVPLLGFRLESRHFAEATEGQAKHLLTVSGPGGDELTVDVFEAAAPVTDPARFADRYLGFLNQAEVSIASIYVRGPGRPGLLYVQPRGQAFARRTVIFAEGTRVVRLTCLSADDARTRAVFEHALETFKLEGGR